MLYKSYWARKPWRNNLKTYFYNLYTHNTTLVSPLWSEGQHDILLIRRQLESEHSRVSHNVSRNNHSPRASISRDHDQTLINISAEKRQINKMKKSYALVSPVNVLSVTDPGAIPGLRTKIIVQDFLQIKRSFKIISRKLWISLPSGWRKVWIIFFCFWPKLCLKLWLERKNCWNCISLLATLIMTKCVDKMMKIKLDFLEFGVI